MLNGCKRFVIHGNHIGCMHNGVTICRYPVFHRKTCDTVLIANQHKCGITGLYSLRRSFYNLFGRMIATHCVNDNAHFISHSLFDD